MKIIQMYVNMPYMDGMGIVMTILNYHNSIVLSSLHVSLQSKARLKSLWNPAFSKVTIIKKPKGFPLFSGSILIQKLPFNRFLHLSWMHLKIGQFKSHPLGSRHCDVLRMAPHMVLPTFSWLVPIGPFGETSPTSWRERMEDLEVVSLWPTSWVKDPDISPSPTPHKKYDSHTHRDILLYTYSHHHMPCVFVIYFCTCFYITEKSVYLLHVGFPLSTNPNQQTRILGILVQLWFRKRPRTWKTNKNHREDNSGRTSAPSEAPRFAWKGRPSTKIFGHNQT